jgi:hypothetical protein
MNDLLYKVKKCAECNEIKLLEEFHKDSNRKDGRRSRCKECRINENKGYYRKHRAENYKNFSKKKFKKMQRNQEHRCLICNKRTDLVIDHDHKKNFVRGLLCNRCNLGLGHFLDSPRRLFRAIVYLLFKRNTKNNLRKKKNSSHFIMNFGNYLLSL